MANITTTWEYSDTFTFRPGWQFDIATTCPTITLYTTSFAYNGPPIALTTNVTLTPFSACNTANTTVRLAYPTLTLNETSYATSSTTDVAANTAETTESTTVSSTSEAEGFQTSGAATSSQDEPSSAPGSSSLTSSVGTQMMTMTTSTSSSLSRSLAPNETGPLHQVPHTLGPPIPVAGIAVGSAVFGALAASLALFFCFRFRQRRSSESSKVLMQCHNGTDANLSTELAAPPSKAGKSSPFPANGVALPPPLQDDELARSFAALRETIRDHVQTYYFIHLVEVERKASPWEHNLDTLPGLLGPDAPVDAAAMDTLLQTPQTRTAAIRLLIAWSIIRNIEPSAPLDKTLLPPELIRCVEAMEPTERIDPMAGHDNLPSTIYASREIDDSLYDGWVTLSKWRAVCGSVLQPIYTTPSHSQLDTRDPRKPNIADLTTLLVYTLQPFVVKGYGQSRVKDLERTITAGAALGWKTFSQPTTWRFDWQGRNGEDIVTFPGLVKIGDEGGRRLKREERVCLAESLSFGAMGTVRCVSPVEAA